MKTLLFILLSMQGLAPGREVAETATAIGRKVLEHRPLFQDDEDRIKTAALVVAVTFRESSFRNNASSDTDDHCLGQIHGRPDLAKDIDACLDVTLDMLRDSMSACGVANPLGVYATGSCTSERGKRISRDRLWLAKTLVRRSAL